MRFEKRPCLSRRHPGHSLGEVADAHGHRRPGDIARRAVSVERREMIIFATRWPIGRPHSDAVADAFFDALALLVGEWLEHESPLSLPTSTDPEVRAAMQYADSHLAEVDVGSVCAAIGVSARSLRRKVAAATGMTWREYLLQSRRLRARALLTEPGLTVLDVATAVGFDSVSAFTRAFRRLAAETPTDYRRRVTVGA